MSTSLGYQINRNPLAQSFYVEEINGVYLTKVDLFFKSRVTTSPVSLQIRPMVNGFPSTSEIIPQSTVYVNGSNVNISDDATAATSFTFDEPLYLRGLFDYAIVVTANSEKYEIFIAQVDEFEVGTTAGRIARNPALGSLFYSANGGTFTAAQDQDLAFKIHRAEFDTSTIGTVILKNSSLPQKLLDINPIQTTAASDTVRIHDVGHGFVVNDPVTIRGLDSSQEIGGIRTTSIMGAAKTISAIDWSGYEITADSSADSDAIGGGVGVLVTKNVPFGAYYSNTQMLLPENTDYFSSYLPVDAKSFAGTETPYQVQPRFVEGTIQETDYTLVPHVVMNDAIETAELGAGVKSYKQRIEISSNDTKVSPLIDLQRSSVTLINALIDNQDSAATVGFNVPLNWVPETSARGGSSAAKHITRKIELVEPAVGLKIIFGGYRPNGANFDVYYRTCEEGVDLRNVDYVYLPSTSNNPTDTEIIFREYQYLAGGDGGDLKEFTQFQIKIVFRSTSSAKVPVIKDLRVIALSV